MLRRLSFVASTLGLVAAVAGCEGGTESSGGTTGVFVDDAGALTCPDVPGTSPMVALGGWDGRAYCIDTIEVTNAQYAAWLETSPDTSGQRPDCAGNTTFVPAPGPPPKNDYPVVNVDFCDAVAFCAAFGKHLCGRITGGPTPYFGHDDPAQSQWFSACTHGGAMPFPYGSTYDPNACNGADAKYGAPLVAFVLPDCGGGSPGIVDMSGNVWEWEDACIPGDSGVPECRRRGGSFSSSAKYMGCDARSARPIDAAEDNTGFRCCAGGG
ncbi:SUMF1/EgtB/PvdO family nonheme iron enzyme [Polyangium sp. y55x31]|uniref:formylglycine-generating enzyme family protein n=1 Tax=Polyangium sp. y55x31 TaxID=3042688 RepID=UPI002482C1DB|nr:SUMF1/EgtB/PvdO family nonheme iron enzyme [Polyangium sp. y55x31]MDI1476029.1 SUMF1/EgtB/PvdO family nonheme iron enzyme [Polyangium sp. y55x31]